ncbi:hypothetical protein, variant 3 [Aphanomyces astaci]|uniref:Transmembrane protein n=1 Tax=Aphanomyces astaci TaxID=112090 RepID=W4H2S9_APHAT|nr:hypothetical protein, variant 3 [Aphanomyces astaci]ETV85463.1 hypothetical protein, variant 3 [Aphanomyces astaci]|eukprot:XP_009825481.1 hypothetical protein, variant 3 [Aphanomyces astaci]
MCAEDHVSSSIVDVAHETSASISAPNKPAHVHFVPVSSTSLGLVDIPDAIVLTPDQVRSASLVVQAILLGGVIAAAVVGSITYVVRSRRALDESIERVHRLVDVAAIRRAIDTSTTAEFHAAATLRLRVLTFRSNVDAVVADSTQKDFDADRWVVVNRATKAVEPTDVAALLARLSVAIDEGDDLLRELAAQDCPAFKSIQEAIASHVKTLRVRHDHISELKATILDKLHQAIRSSSSQRNGLQLDDWTRLKELWVALGLPQADVVAPHGWYQTILRDLEAKDAMLRQLAELKQAVMLPLLSTWAANKDDDEVVVAVDTPSVALRNMNMLLKEAKANQWSHPEFDQLERFVLHTHSQTQQQHTMVLASSVAPLSPPAMLRTCGHHRGGARDDGTSGEDIGRDLAMHDERMKLDFMIHREKLYFDKINTDRILQQQLDIHMKTLEESQRQFHLQARDNREREERMYQRKLDDATKKLERKQAEKRQLVADQAAKDAATATAKFLALRVHAEWKLVKRVLGINVVVVALVAALVCWDAVTSRELLSSTCDVRTSYWTPTHLSVIGCQIMYGAKVGLAMVSGLVFVSICSYLNLSLWGVSILVATALYIFRASWQHVLWRLPHVLWLGMFNYTVGYLLAHDTRHSWSVQHINWRPVVVYIGYPVVSLVVALVVGMWIACDVPVECFHAAVAWCAAHISSLYE